MGAILNGITKNEEFSNDVGGSVGAFYGDSAGSATAGFGGFVGNGMAPLVGFFVDYALQPRDVDNVLNMVDQMNSSTIAMVDTFVTYVSSSNHTLDKILFVASAAASAKIPGGEKIYEVASTCLGPLRSELITKQEAVLAISKELTQHLSSIRYIANLLKVLGLSTPDEKSAMKDPILLQKQSLRVNGAVSVDESVSRNVKSQSCTTAMDDIKTSNAPHATVLADMAAAIEDVNGTVDALVGHMMDVPVLALLTINRDIAPALEAASAASTKKTSLIKTAIDELVSMGDAFTKIVQDYPVTTNMSDTFCPLLTNLAIYHNSALAGMGPKTDLKR